jgi:hypothetical protein
MILERGGGRLCATVTNTLNLHTQIADDSYLAERPVQQLGSALRMKNRRLLEFALKLDLPCRDVNVEADRL